MLKDNQQLADEPLDLPKTRTILCLFLDGLAQAPESAANLISQANLKNLEYYTKNYPSILLQSDSLNIADRYKELASSSTEWESLKEKSLSQIISQAKLKQAKIFSHEYLLYLAWHFKLEEERVLENETLVDLKLSSLDLNAYLKTLNKEIKRLVSDKYSIIFASIPSLYQMSQLEDMKKSISLARRLDKYLAKIIKPLLEQDCIILLFSAFGRAENIFDLVSTKKMSGISSNPSPLILIAKEYEAKSFSNLRDQSQEDIDKKIASFKDFAPSVLSLLELDSPEEFEGRSLIV